MFKIWFRAGSEYLGPEESPPRFPQQAPSFEFELQAARQELAQRSRKPPRGKAAPAADPDCEDSMAWLDQRTRLKNATLMQTRALVVAENEEWAEDCGELGLPAKKPRAPRTIDY